MSSSEGISLSDIGEINDAYLEHIRELTIGEIRRRTEDVTIAEYQSRDGQLRAREILAQFGVLVVNAVVTEDVCACAAAEVSALYEEFVHHGAEVYETERALFQMGSSKLKGYHQLSNYGKAVITVRQGQDQGMVDIFNCDLAIPTGIREIRRVLEDPCLIEILRRPNVKPRNLNVYLNSGITRTRGFHVDSYSENLKAFVYLTDVLSLEDGPYTFVKGSHTDSAFRRANMRLCEHVNPATETPIVNPAAIAPILAAKGSLVVSDQSGFHRGWPQAAGRERMVSVMKYS